MGEGNGDPNCPQSYLTEDTLPPLKLGSWLKVQREAKRGIGRSKISGEQIRRLKELGVWWDKPDDYLNIQFSKEKWWFTQNLRYKDSTIERLCRLFGPTRHLGNVLFCFGAIQKWGR
jgi:hypothetical protein